MKLFSTFLIASLTLIGLGSFTNISETSPSPKLTLVAPDGENRVVDLMDMKSSDWKDEIALVEFRLGEELVETSGILVYSPKVGRADMVGFAGSKSLTQGILIIQKNYSQIPGDKIIIDNLEITSTKEKLSPLIYTIME